jgi:hypothetical protein
MEEARAMNRNGNPENLIVRHPGNTNAAKSGAYSPTLRRARAAQRIEELCEMELLFPPDHPALEFLAGAEAVAGMLFDDLVERGVSLPNGQPRTAVDSFYRAVTRIMKLYAELGLTQESRQAAEETEARKRLDSELEALGADSEASTRQSLETALRHMATRQGVTMGDRLSALRLLTELETNKERLRVLVEVERGRQSTAQDVAYIRRN